MTLTLISLNKTLVHLRMINNKIGETCRGIVSVTGWFYFCSNAGGKNSKPWPNWKTLRLDHQRLSVCRYSSFFYSTAITNQANSSGRGHQDRGMTNMAQSPGTYWPGSHLAAGGRSLLLLWRSWQPEGRIPLHGLLSIRRQYDPGIYSMADDDDDDDVLTIVEWHS